MGFKISCSIGLGKLVSQDNYLGSRGRYCSRIMNLKNAL